MENGFKVRVRDASQTIIINDTTDKEQKEEVMDADTTQSNSSEN